MQADGARVNEVGHHRGPIGPHLRLADFLDREDHAALLAWALANEPRFQPAALAGGVVDPHVRNAFSLRDLGPLRAVFDARVRQEGAGWTSALRATPFDLSEVELELVAYNHGAHFQLHQDTYSRTRSLRGDRMLSAVYYLYREPKAFAGGELRLHRLNARQGEDGLDVPPEQNSLVVFPSWTPHEVRRVECPSRAFADSRFAVNCWLYRAPAVRA